MLQSLPPSEMKSLDGIDEAESFTKPADRLRVGPKSNVPLSRAQKIGAVQREAIMPALFAIILTATQIVLAADSVPKFDLERTCRGTTAADLPGRDSASTRSRLSDSFFFAC